MKFRPHNTWQIILPTGKTINTTIENLNLLYEGGVRGLLDWQEWEEDDKRLNPDQFLNWWDTVFLRAVNESKEAFGDESSLTERLYNNYAKIKSIRQLELPVQMVPATATFSDAIDIFDKINTQGEKLTQAELALTHITATWADARRSMKKTSDRLNTSGFSFDLRFITRSLTAVITERSQWDAIHQTDLHNLQCGWKRLETIFDYLVKYLPDSALIHSTDDLNSPNVLVPLIAYLSKNNGTFRTDDQRKLSVHWLHNALMWGRFDGQVNQRLEEDLAIIRKNPESPWPLLCDRILDQRGRLQVTAKDISEEGRNSRFYKTTYMVFKGKNARDWFNGLPLCNTDGTGYRIHSHHIFPKAYLNNSGWDERDATQRKLINEIANRAFLTEQTNLAISAAAPNEYLPQVKEHYPTALEEQLIPSDPDLWQASRFKEFLECRRKLIADAINAHMKKLLELDEEIETHNLETKDLIFADESETLEHKETWHIDSRQTISAKELVANKAMQLNCIKTVAAFLNSSGGTLLIGTTDEKSVEGLSRDIEFMNGDYDKLEQQISKVTANAIGIETKPFYSLKMEEIEGYVVCRVDVDWNEHGPTWVRFAGETKFYIRNGNSTLPLNDQEAHEYIRNKWP